MKTLNYLTVLIFLLLHNCTPSANSGQAPTSIESELAQQKMLLGNWQSTEDDQYRLEIRSDQKFISFYGSDVISTENWKYYSACPQDCNELDGSCLTTDGEDGSVCYYLVKLTSDELQISMLGGRGNTLIFKRI